MRRLIAWLSAAAGGLALARLLSRRPAVPSAPPGAADERAEALRRKLAQARAAVADPEELTGAEVTVDEAEPAPLDPDARRRAVHEQGRAAAAEMRGDAPRS